MGSVSRLHVLCSIAFLFAGERSMGQDIHFSHFYEAPVMRNPALVGIFTGDIRVQAIHRDQWQSVGVPFKTSLVNMEYKMKAGTNHDYLTLGTSAYRDVAGNGLLTTTQFMPSMAYHKSLGEVVNRYLTAGVSIGYLNKKFDPSTLAFNNQYSAAGYNPINPNGEVFRTTTTQTLDFAAGISYNSAIGERGNYFLGMSVWHILRQRSSFIGDSSFAARRWQWNGGMRMFLSDQWLIHAEGNIYKQGTYLEWMGGGLLRYVPAGSTTGQNDSPDFSIGAGLFIRVSDALIPVVRMSLGRFGVSFSTDINTSKLKTVSQGRGGFEIMLSYIGFTKNSSSTMRQLHCPRF